MIWRDDDIGAGHVNRAGQVIPGTKLDELRATDDLFQARGLTHTIAVMAYGLETRPDLVELILTRRMAVQLHCWTHDDLSVDNEAIAELPMAMGRIGDLMGERPTVLYPPWNRTSSKLEAAAAELGLTVSARKLSIGQYLRGARGLPVNFHYWAQGDVDLLKIALAR